MKVYCNTCKYRTGHTCRIRGDTPLGPGTEHMRLCRYKNSRMNCSEYEELEHLREVAVPVRKRKTPWWVYVLWTLGWNGGVK